MVSAAGGETGCRSGLGGVDQDGDEERAAARGEVRLDKVTRRMATLPVDLARHELLITRAPVPETALIEIVDDIFLPLVRA